MAEVPRLSKEDLMVEVDRLDVPFLNPNDPDHPFSQLFDTLRSDHPFVYQWGGFVGRDLSRRFAVDEKATPADRSAFDNAYIAAYGLMRHSYRVAGRPAPADNVFPTEYPSDKIDIVDEIEMSDSDLLGKLFSDRLHELHDTYPAFLNATHEFAYRRIPGHGHGQSLGAVSVAASEIYATFNTLEAAQ